MSNATSDSDHELPAPGDDEAAVSETADAGDNLPPLSSPDFSEADEPIDEPDNETAADVAANDGTESADASTEPDFEPGAEESFSDDADGEWLEDDLEAAYLQALTAVEEQVPAEADSDETPEPDLSADEPQAADDFSGHEALEDATEEPEVEEPSPDDTAVAEAESDETETDELAGESETAEGTDEAEPTAESAEAAEPEIAEVTPKASEPALAATAPVSTGPRLARGTERPPRAEPVEDYTNVSPAQIIEAAMFVGGSPLTARKLVALLRGSFDVAFVEQTIDELNAAYAAQERPYEIRLGDGGYRMELRADFDRLRHRVYGSGPREVRLAQDVLEVLALIAYRQPITQKEIETHGKPNAGNLIRQLLRRDLVTFERGPGGRKDVQYQTTPRFLSVFGISSLEDLPQAEDLAKK
ncbi:MAG: SMC-Scp complex subunit ScpB [Planctomycetes bacterium]|nr:SMC-Scp complex subunit ScpB [Planctomycetota bacterium]